MKTNRTNSKKIHILTADRSYNVAAVPRPDMAADNAVCFEVCDDAGAPRFCTGDFIFCTAEGDGWRAISTIADETAQARMDFYADRRRFLRGVVLS